MKQCSPVLSKENRKEIAILHSDDCWNLTSYCQKLPSWFYGQSLRDHLGTLHLKMTDFVDKCNVDWSGINNEINGAIILTK